MSAKGLVGAGRMRARRLIACRVNLDLDLTGLVASFPSSAPKFGMRCVVMKTLRVGIASAEDMIARTMRDRAWRAKADWCRSESVVHLAWELRQSPLE